MRNNVSSGIVTLRYGVIQQIQSIQSFVANRQGTNTITATEQAHSHTLTARAHACMRQIKHFDEDEASEKGTNVKSYLMGKSDEKPTT